MSASIDPIGFFSPIHPSGLPHPNENKVWLGRVVEWYFDWGQQAFAIIPGFVSDHSVPVEKIISEKSSLFSQAIYVAIIGLKIISCMTGVLPLAMLVGKFIYRGHNQFSLFERPSSGQINSFFEMAENAKNEDAFSQELSEISFEEVDGLRDLTILVKNIERKKKEFQDIINQFSPFFSEEQLQAISSAILPLEQNISQIETLIHTNRGFIRLNIVQIYNEQRLIVGDKKTKGRLNVDVKIWKELQIYEKFITQFQIALGVTRNRVGGNWMFLEQETDTENVICFKNDLLAELEGRLTPKGIVNLGATCFMNASVQAIISNHDFRGKIKEKHHPIYDSIKEKLRIKLEKFEIFGDANDITDHLFVSWKGMKVADLIIHLNKLNQIAFIKAIDKVIKERDVESLNHETDQVNKKQPVEKQEKPKESRLIRYIRRTFQGESALFLADNMDWETVKKMLNPITMELSDYIRIKKLMSTLRKFVLKYEEDKVKSTDFRVLATELRSAFHFAFPGDGSLIAQHDASVFVEYVLQAIGCTFPCTITRKGEVKGNSHGSEETAQISLLQVPITGGANVSLQKLMNDYMSISIEGAKTDPWKFTNSEGKVIKSFSKWTEKTSIEGAPPKHIQIQLKRFKVGNQKIRSSIDIGNNEVDLSGLFDLESNEKAVYKINAAVIHLGSCTGGHYYSVVESAEKWFKCNDSSVTVEQSPAQELAIGYIYFLERISN